jgi:hypothetical protein
MLDVRSGRMLDNVVVVVEDGRIKQVAHGPGRRHHRRRHAALRPRRDDTAAGA